ncbi:hypothetical protein JD844_032026 [Phrynosoma platyrhinos]|uniref:Uncharacterized protein n=1 Tax=Phrynosoma platyrhinos TaxID=52577 RepID=A0ABQ7T4A4_PHRPL|nr:hypothetical protein JD844_032026 [Phrynosoma platyrhinos]
MTAIVTVEVPPAISEEGNIILHLVPVEQSLPVDPALAKDKVPLELPELPMASDETLITGEGAQEEPTQSPGATTQSSGQSVGESQQGAVVRRVPVRSVVRHVRADEDIPDRRARWGKLIGRTVIEDSRREGRLNCALARRLNNSLLRAMERDSDTLESLAHSYREDLEETARHRERFYGYMEQLINIARESVQEQWGLRLAMYSLINLVRMG